MKKLIKRIFYLIPEKLQNKIRCLYNNLFTANLFYVSYKEDYFNFKFKNGINFKCYGNINGGILIKEAELILKGYIQKYRLKKDDIVVDAGAHIGMFTLYASKKVGNYGRVIAFEPDKENYNKLLKNIHLNNLNNVIALNKGLWSKNTKLNFSDTHDSYSSFINVSYPKPLIKVLVVTLDKELKKLKYKKSDFIKMDIEGAEIEAIKGAKNLLKNNNISLAIASYHFVNKEKTYIKLEKLLQKLGYSVKTGFPAHLTTFAKKSVR